MWIVQIFSWIAQILTNRISGHSKLSTWHHSRPSMARSSSSLGPCSQARRPSSCAGKLFGSTPYLTVSCCRLKRYTIAKRNVVVLKVKESIQATATHAHLAAQYAKDLRYDAEKAATHDGQKMEAISCSQLSEPCLDEFNVIGVDEGDHPCGFLLLASV